jgi:hypothetical protein
VSNQLEIGTEGSGTGTGRNIVFKSGSAGATALALGSSSAQFSRDVTFASDNAFDIGNAGAVRPRHYYGAGYVITGTRTVATLPAASASLLGARYFVTDANATTFASVVAGGGANNVPVYCDGTNWRIG